MQTPNNAPSGNNMPGVVSALHRLVFILTEQRFELAKLQQELNDLMQQMRDQTET